MMYLYRRSQTGTIHDGRVACVMSYAIVVGAVLGAGCGSTQTTAVEAWTADGPVTTREYDGWLDYHRWTRDPARRLSDLESLAVTRRLAAEAAATGVDDDPAVQAQLLRNTNALLIRELRRHTAGSIVDDPTAIAGLVAEWQSRPAPPARVRLRNITKAYPQQATEADRERARAELAGLRETIIQGADFGTTAREHSDSETRYRFGRMGVVKPGQLDPELEDVVFDLEEGEVSQVLETRMGAVLLWCEKVIERQPLTSDQLQERARSRLRKRQMRTAWKDLISRLLPCQNRDGSHGGTPSGPMAAMLGGNGRTSSPEGHRRSPDYTGARVADDQPPLPCGSYSDAQVEAMLAAEARRLGLHHAIIDELEWARLHQLAAERLKVLVEDRVAPVKDADIRRHYEAHRDELWTEPKVRLRAIVVPVSVFRIRESIGALKPIAEAIGNGSTPWQEAVEGVSTDFADVQTLSGWRTRTQVAALGPIISRAVLDLERGSTSDVIRRVESRDGSSTLWIIQLLESQPRRHKTLDEARVSVENTIGQRRVDQATADITSEVAAALDVRPVIRSATRQ